MLQGKNWQEPLAPWRDRIVAPLISPRFFLNEHERWSPVV
jgi:hypothetical protein